MIPIAAVLVLLLLTILTNIVLASLLSLGMSATCYLGHMFSWSRAFSETRLPLL